MHSRRQATTRVRTSGTTERPGRTRLIAGPAWQRLILLAVVFMPFQYALTMQVGFPLKISEVLLALGMAAYVLGRFKRRLRWDAGSTFVLIMTLALILSAIANFSAGEIVPPPGYERGLGVDLLLYLGYGLFALAAWAMVRRIDRDLTARAVVASIWTCGAAVALQWGAILTGSTALIANLGFRTRGVRGDLESLRSGPFLEGQHLGFFAGAALLVALYRRSWAAAAVAAACVVYSQSTTAYVGVAVGLLLMLILQFRTRVVAPLLGVGLLATTVVVTIPAARELLGRQLAKLGFTEFAPDYAFATTSLNLRNVKGAVAFEMMGDHPAFGVGPGRFGVFFPQYRVTYALAYEANDSRPIAENAYGHVGAELGVVALIAFAGLIVTAIIWNRRAHPLLLTLAGFLAVGVATQSSWTFLPIWVFIGLLTAAVARGPREVVPESRPGERSLHPPRLPERAEPEVIATR